MIACELAAIVLCRLFASLSNVKQPCARNSQTQSDCFGREKAGVTADVVKNMSRRRIDTFYDYHSVAVIDFDRELQ